MNHDVTPIDFIVALTPLVIVVLSGWFFVRRIGAFYKSHADHLKHQSEALERIASALEKRSGQ